jgi:hypothetical protein
MKHLLPFFLFLFSLETLAQRVAYSPDFEFKDGIYLSFLDFKNNNPVPITHLLSDFDIRASDYLLQVLDSDSITFYDNLLEERVVDVRSVWGYCKANRVYIGWNTVSGSERWEDRGWFPIVSLGAYSYFTAVMTMTRFVPPTPGVMMQSRGTIMDDGAMFPDQGSSYQESVPVQLLLDFSNGNVIQLGTGDLTAIAPATMRELLGRDVDLLREFDERSKRDQKQTSMFYIRLFNERNPIYFPQNQ